MEVFGNRVAIITTARTLDKKLWDFWIFSEYDKNVRRVNRHILGITNIMETNFVFAFSEILA